MIHQNVLYANSSVCDASFHSADVYLPNEKRLSPSLLWIHGGHRGDKSRESALGEALASCGIVVVTVNYRLVPESRHPAQVEDIAAAIAWWCSQAHSFGASQDAIFVGGHSSGAVLAAMVAADPGYLDAHGLPPNTLAGAICISGYYDLTPADQWLVDWFGDSVDQRRSISPLTNARQAITPFFLMYAEHDEEPSRTTSVNFARALIESGHRTQTHEFPGRDHISIIKRFHQQDDDVKLAICSILHPDARF